MPNTILCIEFGSHITHFAEVAERDGKIEIMTTHSFDTPEDQVRDGKVRVSERMLTTLREQINLCGIKTDKVAFSVVSSKIIYKSVTIPKKRTDKDIQTTVDEMFCDLFPVEQELYTTHFSIQSKSANEMNLDVFAVPRDYIGSDECGMNGPFDRIAYGLDMKCVGIVDSSFGLIQAAANDLKYRNILLINLQDEHVDIALINDKNVKSKSTIWCGVGRIANIVNRHAPIQLDGNYDAAMMMTRVDMLSTPTGGDEQSDNVQKAVRREVDNLLDNIESKTMHLLKMADNMQFNEVYVTGMGADWPWVVKEMSRRFQVPVQTMSFENYISFPEQDTWLLNAYITCACSVNHGANFLSDTNLRNFVESLSNFFLKK